MTTLLVTSLVAAFVTFGAAPVSAAHPEDVNDVTDSSNFTVNFPSATDHYPGDKNTENGSIEYFVVGSDAFAEMGAEDGLYFNWIIVHAEYEGVDWIDYSACTTDNTEAFGIDRGNNNSGTQYDVDLVARQKQVQFRDNGIVIEFLNWEDISNDPPYMAAEDAVVAAQGAGLSGPEVEELSNVLESLRQHGMTLIVVDHNMHGLLNLIDRAFVIQFGSKIAEGEPDEIKNDPKVQEAYLGGEEI